MDYRRKGISYIEKNLHDIDFFDIIDLFPVFQLLMRSFSVSDHGATAPLCSRSAIKTDYFYKFKFTIIYKFLIGVSHEK